jgi:hypothetical protein
MISLIFLLVLVFSSSTVKCSNAEVDLLSNSIKLTKHVNSFGFKMIGNGIYVWKNPYIDESRTMLEFTKLVIGEDRSISTVDLTRIPITSRNDPDFAISFAWIVDILESPDPSTPPFIVGMIEDDRCIILQDKPNIDMYEQCIFKSKSPFLALLLNKQVVLVEQQPKSDHHYQIHYNEEMFVLKLPDSDSPKTNEKDSIITYCFHCNGLLYVYVGSILYSIPIAKLTPKNLNLTATAIVLLPFVGDVTSITNPKNYLLRHIQDFVFDSTLDYYPPYLAFSGIVYLDKAESRATIYEKSGSLYHVSLPSILVASTVGLTQSHKGAPWSFIYLFQHQSGIYLRIVHRYHI